MDERSGARPIGAKAYLERAPERLVLEGYRGWTWAVALGSKAPWQRACVLYREELGAAKAPHALDALDGFASTLGLCASCPLRMRCAGAHSVCRDEALVLGLVAAIQHADEPAIELCLASVCRPAAADRAALAAGIYALMLRSLQRVLLPVPVPVIAGIAAGAREEKAPEGATLH